MGALSLCLPKRSFVSFVVSWSGVGWRQSAERERRFIEIQKRKKARRRHEGGRERPSLRPLQRIFYIRRRRLDRVLKSKKIERRVSLRNGGTKRQERREPGDDERNGFPRDGEQSPRASFFLIVSLPRSRTHPSPSYQ